MFRFPSNIQECPVCGRPVEVRDQYAGQSVNCWHCGGEFVAGAPRQQPRNSAAGLLRRAERLLERADRALSAAGGPSPAW